MFFPEDVLLQELAVQFVREVGVKLQSLDLRRLTRMRVNHGRNIQLDMLGHVGEILKALKAYPKGQTGEQQRSHMRRHGLGSASQPGQRRIVFDEIVRGDVRQDLIKNLLGQSLHRACTRRVAVH